MRRSSDSDGRPRSQSTASSWLSSKLLPLTTSPFYTLHLSEARRLFRSVTGNVRPLSARDSAQERGQEIAPSSQEVPMRAIRISEFGSPEVLALADVPPPTPGAGELLVRVTASGTNPVEAKIRASGHWSKIVLPATLGYDAAGLVEAVGSGVSEFRAGDAVYFTPEIFGNVNGTHAEFTVVPAHIV